MQDKQGWSVKSVSGKLDGFLRKFSV